jgi:hypothetical protein
MELARLGTLDATRRRRATRWAERLIHTDAYGQSCLGYLALSALHPRGETARRALAAALERSERAGAYYRWLCLRAADERGLLDSDRRAEAAALAAREGLRAGEEAGDLRATLGTTETVGASA